MTEFSRLRRVVEEAAVLEGEERLAFLDRECGSDAALRAEAEELLLTQGDAAFMAPPMPGIASAALRASERTDGRVGTNVGPYRILRVLGSGGMGTVFEAEQQTPSRRVALKVLHGGSMSDAAVQRFQHEAQVLARLRHPGVAQIFATGVQVEEVEGVPLETPWFAMEYIEDARSLLDYASSAKLDLDGRLRLFKRICEAVQHGHQKGVVHRDLKPDNLLVDPDGNPKVIDFGVAFSVDPEHGTTTRLTVVGQIVGTLAYMSPEQFDELDVDTQSDVFSLGVCLYELISGRLPFDIAGKPLPRIAQAVCEQNPARLTDIPTDLESVLIKALEKQPERRYSTAAALAADIERVLTKQPVDARAPSATYYLMTFARRHRVLVGAGAAVLGALLLGGGVSLAFGMRAKRAEVETRELFATVLDRSVETTSTVADELIALPGGVDIGRRLVANAVVDLEDLAARSPGSADVRAHLAEALFRRGSFEARVGGITSDQARAAAQHLDAAIELSERLLEDDPGSRELRLLVAKTLLERSMIESHLPDHEAALATILEAEDLLDALRTEWPADAELIVERAYGHEAHARAMAKLGRTAEMEPPLQAARALYAEAATNDPGDRMHALRQSNTWLSLAGRYKVDMRMEESIAATTAALELLDALVDAHPDWLPAREQRAKGLIHGGDTHRHLKDKDAARDWTYRAVEEYRALSKLDTFNIEHELNVWRGAMTLGIIEMAPDGDPALARKWLEECHAGLVAIEREGRMPEPYAGYPKAALGLLKQLDKQQGEAK